MLLSEKSLCGGEVHSNKKQAGKKAPPKRTNNAVLRPANNIQSKRVTLAKRKTTLYRKAEELALRTGYYTRVQIFNTKTKSKLSYISSNTPRDFFADGEPFDISKSFEIRITLDNNLEETFRTLPS